MLNKNLSYSKATVNRVCYRGRPLLLIYSRLASVKLNGPNHSPLLLPKKEKKKMLGYCFVIKINVNHEWGECCKLKKKTCNC